MTQFLPPLRFSIPLVLLLFGAVLGIFSSLYDRALDDSAIEQTVRQRANFVGTQVASMTAFYLENAQGVSAQRALAVAGTSPDLRMASIISPSDGIAFCTRLEWVGLPVRETPAGQLTDLIANVRRHGGGQTVVNAAGTMLSGAFPFPYPVPGEGGQLRPEAQGVVLLQYDLALPKAVAKDYNRMRLFFGGAILLGLCGMFMVFFHRMLTARVTRLNAAARAFAKGDLSARAGMPGNDELSQLGRGFDEMAAELQRRDAELRASEQRFRQLADHVSEIFWLFDRESGRYIYVSPAFERIFDRPAEELLRDPDTWNRAVHADDRAEAIAVVSRVVDSEEQADYRIVRPDGSERWLRVRASPVPTGNGSIHRVAGVAVDITARKKARVERDQFERKLEETQRLESLGVLAGGIAHDFNNLLTGILGNASLARMEVSPTDPVQEHLSEIETVAQRAGDLCKQMLAYSGKGRFEVRVLDLNSLIRETAQLVQVSISKNATITFELESDLPAIQADGTQMRQVVMNLLINAGEAMEGRNGTIKVKTSTGPVTAEELAGAVVIPEQLEGEYVCLSVADTGSGMAADKLKRIFEPFYTTKFTGRGLGLSAVLGIVRGHRGALKVESVEGVGTIFSLYFPASEEMPEPVIAPVLETASWQAKGTVLLVDDEAPVRQVTLRMLQALGFGVITATDGAEGVRRFTEQRSEVIAVLMDLTMPVLDGEQAFRRIRALDSEVPVFLMSGFSEQDATQRFTGMGIAGFLQKPFRPENLQEVLARALKLPASSRN